MVKKADIPKHIIKTALNLAAEHGWKTLSMRDITVASGQPLATVHTHFRNKAAILEAFTRQVTATVLATEDAFDPQDPPRDRLFDVLMSRFDALSAHRAGMIAILKDSRKDGPTMIAAAPAVREAMAWMLEAAGISTSGFSGKIRIGAVMVVWLATLRVWAGDDSPDMARTMAALDRHLRRADSLVGGWPGTDRPESEAA